MVKAQSKIGVLLCKDQVLECLTAIGKFVEIVWGRRTAVVIATGVEEQLTATHSNTVPE